MNEIVCQKCGTTVEPDEIGTWLMFDNHTFRQLKSDSVDGLIAEAESMMQIRGEANICPARLLHAGKEVGKEIGPMVHDRGGRFDDALLKKWRQAMLDSPVAQKLLAARAKP